MPNSKHHMMSLITKCKFSNRTSTYHDVFDSTQINQLTERHPRTEYMYLTQ